MLDLRTRLVAAKMIGTVDLDHRAGGEPADDGIDHGQIQVHGEHPAQGNEQLLQKNLGANGDVAGVYDAGDDRLGNRPFGGLLHVEGIDEDIRVGERPRHDSDQS